jgi:cysteine synthase A
LKIHQGIDELVGGTPLLRLNNIEKQQGLNAALLAKLESFNPTGSAKDRPARAIIEKAEKDGLLKKNSVIIEPTSGNTGIGLAAIGAAKGYRVIIVMPDTMSVERQKLMTCFGAQLVLTDGSKGMNGAIEKAEELKKEISDSIIAGQFVNAANPQSHYETTGPEIWEDTDGKVDVFVASIGTGGTISGTGKFLKEKNPQIKVIGVEPSKSPLLTKGESGSHGIQGIGANFIPETLDRDVYDEIVTVSDEAAMEHARALAKKEGVLAGISSGATLCAAIEIAKRPENKGKTIVALLTDTGERYLSTALFEAEKRS